MQDNKINTNKLKVSKFVYLIVFFLFLVFIISLTYRTLVDYKAKGNLTISEFINNRNTVEETILPERGTIYDTLGNPLAQDVSSYTIIAYLDESRSKDSKKLRHVKDKEKTAKVLSEHIDETYDRILEILNKDAYQVEFGTAGKNLSQIKMEEIKALNLPGIDFIKSTKRYYPNGDFASYLLGYTKNKTINDNLYMVGELGIEGYYNEELTGKEGYLTYEKDGRGNKIANSREYKEDAIDGSNVYLTIDTSVQLFIENATKKAAEQSQAEWVVMGIMDAKTGAILGYTSTPSFDPNIRNLKSYLDPLVSYTYEPGSTMKTFSYMCAIQNGRYNGQDTFLSGSMTYTSAYNDKDTVTIKDWNSTGWGTITYDYGFAMSSNIGVANLLKNKVITKNELKACYEKFGFGKKTNITLNNELTGDISFKYDVEAATAGYGQGIMVSPIQILQGMTIVANDGIMLKPYIVSKIVSSDGKTVLENKKEELGRVVDKSTTDKMKELLRSVINPDSSKGTGSAYYMADYDLIGKTGTASIFENGKYLVGSSDYIYSFAGLYPGDDPDIIIYMAMKKPKSTSTYMSTAVKDVVVNISKYLNIDTDESKEQTYKTQNYLGKSVTSIQKELTDKGLKVITLGTGNKIINQYPLKNITLTKNNLVVLLTNDYDKTMVDLSGLSYKECKEVLDLMNIEYELSGYGYVTEQSIPPGTKVSEKLKVTLSKLY